MRIGLIIIGIMIYFSLLILILGLSNKAINWYRAKPSLTTVLYPRPQKGTRFLRIIADIFMLPQLFENNPGLWATVVIFHLSLLGILIGHCHLMGTFPGVLEKYMESPVMEGLGVTLGLLGLISILVFLVRRLASLRNISYPGDYLVLLLLFGIFASGEILRLTSVNIDVFREYMHSLLLMHSNTCCILNGSWSAWFFPTHLLLVGLLLICVPFSSLIHMFSSFVTICSRRM